MKKILSIVTIMLAMVLCFTGCGKKTYTEDDISAACANAKIADTALRSYSFAYPPENFSGIATNFDFFASEYEEGSYYVTFDGYGVEDLSDYLGTKYEGYFYVEYDEYGYLEMALWFEDKATYDAVINDIYVPLSMSDMRSYAEQGYLVGCYPMATVGN